MTLMVRGIPRERSWIVATASAVNTWLPSPPAIRRRAST